jgi:hypothetical protein
MRRTDPIRAAKAQPCADCGQVFPYYVMDLDHVPERGLKRFGLAASHGHSREEIEAEVAKCDPVCANCHRVRTRYRNELGTTRGQFEAELRRRVMAETGATPDQYAEALAVWRTFVPDPIAQGDR